MFNLSVESRILVAGAAEMAEDDLYIISQNDFEELELTGLDEMILMAIYPELPARVKISCAEDADFSIMKNL